MRSRSARRSTALARPPAPRCSTALLLAAALALCAPAGARAAGAASAVTLPGAPLSVSVGAQGQCQSSYPGLGNNFFPAEGALGDCGFFLGFPASGNPAFLQAKVFGFEGSKGPGLSAQYTPVAQGVPSGSGSATSPYQLVTSYKISDASETKENDYALVEETTSYVNGQPQFTSTFTVENVTGQPASGTLSPAPSTSLRFHAIFAGDLMTGGSNFAAGVLVPGSPRFIGGENETTGVLAGFSEAGAPSPPWSDYEVGCWNVVPEPEGRCPATSLSDRGIWSAVRDAGAEAPVFNGDIDPNPIDDGAGVSWDDRLGKPLGPGERATYAIVARAQIPTGLSVQPSAQAHTVGQTATVSVAATDSTGVPYANRRLVYTIGPANPKTGSVLTNASGVATLSYVGTAAGNDTIQLFLDLAGAGAQTAHDPAASASVAWLAASPTPSSRYRVKGVSVNSSGVVTIVLVPLQAGRASVQVSVPTARVSRAATGAVKRAKCKRGEMRIGRACRPRTTVSGRAAATARAGVPVRITVAPSPAVKRALVKGRTLTLTAKLLYASQLGGKPTTQSFYLTARGKRRSAHRKRRKAR
jgi:hypothetical protein